MRGTTLPPERVEATGNSEFGFGTDCLALSISPGTCPGGFIVGTWGTSSGGTAESFAESFRLPSVSSYCSVAVSFNEIRLAQESC